MSARRSQFPAFSFLSSEDIPGAYYTSLGLSSITLRKLNTSVRISSSVQSGCSDPGDALPCRCAPLSTNSSAPNNVKPTSMPCGGKIAHRTVPGPTAMRSILGAITTTDRGANATGAMAASAPATTSPIPCCTRASGRYRPGCLPPFWCASPVRPGALRGR
jgi:hypothetical protein